MTLRTRVIAGASLIALMLVCCQIGLGALVILMQDPIWIALAHQALGVLTFATITGLMTCQPVW